MECLAKSTLLHPGKQHNDDIFLHIFIDVLAYHLEIVHTCIRLRQLLHITTHIQSKQCKEKLTQVQGVEMEITKNWRVYLVTRIFFKK